MAPTELLYLGPAGTWSEEAARRLAAERGLPLDTCHPRRTLLELVEALAAREAELAVLPAENLLEGSVTQTWDALLAHPGVQLLGEAVQPVHHHLLGQAGLPLDRVRAVLSHPQALAQCRMFLRSHLPDAQVQETVSTAEAARVVGVNQLPLAAIGTEAAARTYGLTILAWDIQDSPDNRTRFLLAGSENLPAPEPTGDDRTSLVCAADRDRPGGLRDLLNVFADRGLSLTRIESRPSRRVLGEYVFHLDLAGHRADPPVAAALAELETRGWLLRLFGSYPAARSEA